MTERGHSRVGRALITAGVLAVAAAGTAYAFGPGARADQAGQEAAPGGQARERLRAGRAADGAPAPAAPRAGSAADSVTADSAESAGRQVTDGGSCATAANAPKRQLRGVWIATVHNLDWPSRPGLTEAQQRDQYVKILDAAVKNRLNAVFVQVRPASDAIYRSALEPWSQWLTGKAGQDPGWDPLPFLIEEAHRRGLEFHAWFNPFRAADTASAKLPANHPARVHPDWVVKHEGKLYYNPGLPEVRDWITRVVTDVVTRYDVDGVHFDDYFYPYPGNGTAFADSAAYKKYGKGKPRADWRRGNVNAMVAQVSRAVHAAKPYVKFGISPFGIWRNKAQDPEGSATSGMSAYDAIYADPRAWIKARSVDYVIPQLYWPRGFEAADYATLVKWWANAVRGSGVDLYIGQALYQVGTSGAWKKPGELPAHLGLNRKYPEVGGDVYFSAAQLLKNPLGVLDRLRKDYYARPALLPLLSGLPTAAPAAPKRVRYAGGTLTWQAQQGVRAYGIYRVAAGTGGKCATADARNLVAVLPAAAAPTYRATTTGAYYVTAIDRLGNESPAVPAGVT
ncbi:family 10 glycosylhydrolase [Microbispora sp. RL4-1S]|uniref:Family 10 glycosylhydrolase n=1 Tax=Microbispora oryzae TaxID=2806554 RepID=A0A941AM77_9ACTN|nr:family 10 glycosylhydrolase [Microbispora oryzae]MBP2708087.1 family 10 glycosylhydrolase [Microbispora oryzae]